jgi:hypothetical protein
MLPGESAGDAPPAWAVGDETAEAIILEEALLDEEMKQRVLQRVEIVARVRPLPIQSLTSTPPFSRCLQFLHGYCTNYSFLSTTFETHFRPHIDL